MSKVWYKLEDIEDFEHTAQNFFKASYAPTLEENAANIDLWTDENFIDLFEQQSEKSILLKETEDPWGSFKNKYSQWIARNGALIANEAYTLFMKYNPIHNYDRHEEYTGSDTITKTPTNWLETKTETPNNWKETTTQKPTNWEKTTTQTPTAWEKTDTDTFTDYTETDTQTPTGWKTETKSTDFLNPSIDVNKVVPFDSDTLTAVSATQKMINNTEEQKGTMQDQRTITGSKTHTSEQTGTYQTTEEQAGTYETERTETGSRSTTTAQTGTFEDETEYGKVVDIYGNIGTLTTGAMIKETVELYDSDFIARWLNRFFNTYCAYV